MNPYELKAIVRASKMLAGARSAQVTAHNCYTRYMQRPDTETGRREHQRHEHWQAYYAVMLKDAETTLEALLEGAGHDPGR